MFRFYNTLSRKKEIFKPIHKGWVGLYTCGPTVYNYAHIGNLRTYIFEDILRRVLEYRGYKVRHVMNITDVGHLTSDRDLGEDKVEKEAKKEDRSVWDITRFYTSAFKKDIEKLNIKRANILVPATQTIKEQIKIIEALFKNGYAYETSQAIYFDVEKFKNYTKLSRQKLNEKLKGARDEVVIDPEKKHQNDFALWFKLIGRFQNHIMQWPSPWGDGFPGWHIECSAISTKYLGQPFDIHTGGVDHINTHHTNEIAQSEGAYIKPLAKFWMHGEFLLIDASKMAKSEGNFITLDTILDKGFSTLAFRYLTLTAHYRSKLNFTWDSLRAAENSLKNLYDFIQELMAEKQVTEKKEGLRTYKKSFEQAIFDDLDIPKALAVVWKIMHDFHKNPAVWNSGALLKLLYDFDKVLSLNLDKVKKESIPVGILILAEKREEMRKNKQWREADQIREKILSQGFMLEDTPKGPRVKRKN